MACLVTCEHGGNAIPARYRPFLAGQHKRLASHRGYDAGALQMAKELAASLHAPLFAATVSRLLVDLNRSVGHPNLHSAEIRVAPVAIREAIVARYYLPYRTEVEQHVGRVIARGGRAIHVSSHSFTPELDGDVRTADVGLLYDPARPGEAELCRHWQMSLRTLAPKLNVRRNYPYLGKGDGLTSHLRKRFPSRSYIGVELEINQKHVLGAAGAWRAVRAAVIASLRDALAA